MTTPPSLVAHETRELLHEKLQVFRHGNPEALNGTGRRAVNYQSGLQTHTSCKSHVSPTFRLFQPQRFVCRKGKNVLPLATILFLLLLPRLARLIGAVTQTVDGFLRLVLARTSSERTGVCSRHDRIAMVGHHSGQHSSGEDPLVPVLVHTGAVEREAGAWRGRHEGALQLLRPNTVSV